MAWRGILHYHLIKKAIYWVKKYHQGQLKWHGEESYIHLLEVAYIISEHILQTNVIVASILHNIIEDTEVTIDMIISNFGYRVAEMVDMLTRDRPDGTNLTIEKILYNAYQKDDKEVILIKCIDRLHDMQTLNSMTPYQQYTMVKETVIHFISFSIYLVRQMMIKTDFAQQLNKLCYKYAVINKNTLCTPPLEDSYQLPNIIN